MEIPLQIISWSDFPLIFFLFFFELLLSLDNAALLSMIVHKLPQNDRKRALFIGVISSFILRALVILTAGFLIKILWVQIIGGLYLLFLALKHILTGIKFKNKQPVTKKQSFWTTVLAIELTDLLFAIDSILAAFALTATYYPFDMISHKIWIIYVGGMMGVVFVRYIASELAHVIHSYPNLEKIAYLLIGWMGLKLVIDGSISMVGNGESHSLIHSLFWLGSLLIIIIGFLSTKWDKKV